MDINIISSAPTMTFTSGLQRIEAEVDCEKLRVTIIDRNKRTVFDEVLYAYGGRVALCGLDRLMEEHMERYDMPYDSTWIRFQARATMERRDGVWVFGGATLAQATITYHLFYGRNRYHGGMYAWQKSHWLNAAQAKVSFVGSVEVLNYHCGMDGKVREKRTVVYEKGGEVLTKDMADTVITAEDTGAHQSVVDYNAIQEALGADRIRSISVAQGERLATLYYVDGPVVPFIFRNAYWTLEVVALRCAVTRKATTDKSTATLNGRLSVYDRRNRHAFEVQTAPMMPEEAKAVEQMCQSGKVWLYGGSWEPDDRLRVVITDYTMETGNTDDKLQTAKLTFEFEDRRLLTMEEVSEVFGLSFLPTFS